MREIEEDRHITATQGRMSYIFYRDTSYNGITLKLYINCLYVVILNTDGGLPWWHSSKDPPANAGDVGSIPGWERSPRAVNGNPVQYSCLESPMDRGTRWATVHEVTKNQT